MIELNEITRVEAKALCIAEFGYHERMFNYLDSSEHFISVFWDGGLLGLFGTARPTMLASYAMCWFAETPLLAKHSTVFLRATHRVLAMFLAHYTEIVGLSYQARSVAWLTWLGAEFGPPAPDGGRVFVFRRPVHG